jgi:hypothetical protein
MDGRWLLLGFGLLFGTLTVGFVFQGKALQALIGVVQTLVTLGLFWWYTAHDERVDTRLQRFLEQ